MIEFELTEELLELVRNIQIRPNGEVDTPALNSARPYGGEDVYNDIVRILGLDSCDKFKTLLPNQQTLYVYDLNSNVAYAMQIVIQSAGDAAKAGVYQWQKGFWKRMGDLPKETPMEFFRLEDSHLKLLAHAKVVWEATEYGAPTIDVVRPYGKECVHESIRDILGWYVHDPLSQVHRIQGEQAYEAHRQMDKIVQIVFDMAVAAEVATPGLYCRKDGKWKKQVVQCRL